MARLLNRLVGNHERLLPLLEAQTKNRLAATLLFAGPSGIGKRLAALALAQSLVCERETSGGCGECGPCIRIEKGQSESLLQIAPDGAMIKIEQAREILQFIALRKIGRARIVLIDQAHLMNPQAANSLLKSLEEPPDGTYFLMLTPLAAAILPTIRSRAQLVRMRPLTAAEMSQILGPTADPWVIEASQGSLEVAARLSESREEYRELEEATLAYLAAASGSFPAQEVSRLRELTKDRTAQQFFANLLQGYLRDLMRTNAGLKPLAAGIFERLEGAKFGVRELDRLAEASSAMEQDMARNVDRGLLLENFAIEWREAFGGR